MTRSPQQPPASSRTRAESASAGEETSATAEPGTTEVSGSGAVSAARAVPPSEPAARTGADGGTVTGAPQAQRETEEAGTETAAEGATATRPQAGRAPGTGGATEPATGIRPESEPDSGTTAAAQSRLPALVRTMTATAIGRPQEPDGPVGRPGKAVLAGAAVAGVLLVSLPFLVFAGDEDKDPEQPSVVAAGTVLDGSAQETPGEFAVTPPETGSPDADAKRTAEPDKPVKPVRQVPAPAPEPEKAEETPEKKAVVTKDEPKKQSDVEKPSGGTENQPAKATSGVTFSDPVSFRSHLSGRCIDVPEQDFSDGKALHVWDCNNAPAQKWRFASDGTVRIGGKCLDVAGARFSDGTPMQIARCNGNAAQQFTLNGSHDLVNTVVGMCVDIAGANRSNGAALQLLTCTGNPAQKWST